MDTFTKTLESLWQVLAIGLLFGAGIPIVFAFGIRFLSTGEVSADGTVSRRNPAATVAGYLCFAACLGTVVVGILFIMKSFLANDFGIHIF